jgi:predicted DNA-binding transcriptional regulator AlpA
MRTAQQRERLGATNGQRAPAKKADQRSRLVGGVARDVVEFDLDRVVSEARAAEILGYSKDTLRREFRAGRGPPRVRLSARRIGYRLSVLYAHVEARTEQPGASA